MNTSFGFHSLSTSPAFRRIEAAGREFQARQERETARLAEQRAREIREAAKARELAVATARRLRLINRFDEAFEMTRRRNRTMAEIAAAVARKYNVTVNELRGKRRARYLVIARHEAMARCRYETRHSFPEIGRFFGCDHTSVLYGVRHHEERMRGQS